MKRLGADAQNVLEAARASAEVPPAGLKERLRTQLQARLVDPAAVEPSLEPPSGAGASGWSVVAKSVGAVATAAAAAWLVVNVSPSGGPDDQDVPARDGATVEVKTTLPEAVEAADLDERGATPPESETVGETPSRVPSPERLPERRAPTRKASPPVVDSDGAPGHGPDLAAEARLVAEIQQALRDGDDQRAADLADRHRRRFTEGILEEERLAAELVAACRLEADDVDALRSELKAKFPDTVHASRIDDACRVAE